jgi:hypothetical protein
MGPVKPTAGPGRPVQKPSVPEIPGASRQFEPPVPAASFKPAVSQNPASVALLLSNPPETFKHVAFALGLPQDMLSFTLIAFTRLFSLPMDAGLLASLRREVLAAGVSLPKAGGEKAKTAAHALAAAATAARGLGLSPEALEEYAAALSAEGRPGEEGENSAFRQFNSGELRRLYEEFMAGEHGLLPFLNRIPAKDGRYWAVWPFKISIDGVDLRVFIRILKREDVNSPAQPAAVPDRLIADVTGPRRRWQFIVDKFTCTRADSGGDGGETFRAEIGVYPPLPSRELEVLRKEAEEVFAGMGAEIGVRNGGEGFSPGIFFPAETLPSVDGEA